MPGDRYLIVDQAGPRGLLTSRGTVLGFGQQRVILHVEEQVERPDDSDADERLQLSPRPVAWRRFSPAAVFPLQLSRPVRRRDDPLRHSPRRSRGRDFREALSSREYMQFSVMAPLHRSLLAFVVGNSPSFRNHHASAHVARRIARFLPHTRPMRMSVYPVVNPMDVRKGVHRPVELSEHEASDVLLRQHSPEGGEDVPRVRRQCGGGDDEETEDTSDDDCPGASPLPARPDDAASPESFGESSSVTESESPSPAAARRAAPQGLPVGQQRGGQPRPAVVHLPAALVRAGRGGAPAEAVERALEFSGGTPHPASPPRRQRRPSPSVADPRSRIRGGRMGSPVAAISLAATCRSVYDVKAAASPKATRAAGRAHSVSPRAFSTSQHNPPSPKYVPLRSPLRCDFRDAGSRGGGGGGAWCHAAEPSPAPGWAGRSPGRFRASASAAAAAAAQHSGGGASPSRRAVGGAARSPRAAAAEGSHLQRGVVRSDKSPLRAHVRGLRSPSPAARQGGGLPRRSPSASPGVPGVAARYQQCASPRAARKYQPRDSTAPQQPPLRMRRA